MLKYPSVRCAFRLLTLAVMIGALAFLVSNEPVNAGTIEECDQQYGYCIYANCRNLTGDAYNTCRDNCDHAYLECRFDPAYEPLPAPYPVITHDLQWCLQSCMECNSIPDLMDRGICVETCENWCFENNPKP